MARHHGNDAPSLDQVISNGFSQIQTRTSSTSIFERERFLPDNWQAVLFFCLSIFGCLVLRMTRWRWRSEIVETIFFFFLRALGGSDSVIWPGEMCRPERLRDSLLHFVHIFL